MKKLLSLLVFGLAPFISSAKYCETVYWTSSHNVDYGYKVCSESGNVNAVQSYIAMLKRTSY